MYQKLSNMSYILFQCLALFRILLLWYELHSRILHGEQVHRSAFSQIRTPFYTKIRSKDYSCASRL
jgi:hypothetical protein